MTAVSRRLDSSLLFEFTRIIVAIPTVAKVKGTNVSISIIPGNSSGIAETDTISNEETEILKRAGIPRSETARTLPTQAANAAVSGRVRIRRYPSFSMFPFAKASAPRKSATKAAKMAETGTSSLIGFPSDFASSLSFIVFTVCLA